MKQLILVGVVLAAMAVTGTAEAAEPNNQACLGKDFSGYAQAPGPFGQLLTTFTVNGVPVIQGGLGAEVQNHLAGLVPDTVIPNSCNN